MASEFPHHGCVLWPWSHGNDRRRRAHRFQDASRRCSKCRRCRGTLHAGSAAEPSRANGVVEWPRRARDPTGHGCRWVDRHYCAEAQLTFARNPLATQAFAPWPLRSLDGTAKEGGTRVVPRMTTSRQGRGRFSPRSRPTRNARCRSRECRTTTPSLDANRSRRGESCSVPHAPCRRDSSHPRGSCRTPHKHPACGSARTRRSPRDPTCSSLESPHSRSMTPVGARNGVPTESSRSAWCSS